MWLLISINPEQDCQIWQDGIFCFIMSLSIEVLQPLIDGFQSSDITDVITNVTGGMLGYVFYVMLRPVTFRILNYLKTQE
ncbi:MAG: VanZ family protein [Ruminococcus sp.]|nr:VanZ family protein [Ruminococcus sp.]